MLLSFLLAAAMNAQQNPILPTGGPGMPTSRNRPAVPSAQSKSTGSLRHLPDCFPQTRNALYGRSDSTQNHLFHGVPVDWWESTRHDPRIDQRARATGKPALPIGRVPAKAMGTESSIPEDSVPLVWQQYYATAGFVPSDAGSYVTMDKKGNVYATGYSDSELTFYDIVTLKYDQNGKMLWHRRYDGDHAIDFPSAIAVDSAGNVYVVGSSFTMDTYYDYVTIKYDSTGKQLWVARYDGPDHDLDIATSLAVDRNGNVYVGGASFSLSNFYDYLTVKYNKDGVQQWTARYNGPLDFDDGIDALTIDDSANVYVTGMSNSITGLGDVVTIKYSTDGVQKWISRYDGLAHLSDEGYSMAIDHQGHLYIVGVSTFGSFDSPFGVVLCHKILAIGYGIALGNQIWAQYIGAGIVGIDNVGDAVRTDPLGHCILGGVIGRYIMAPDQYFEGQTYIGMYDSIGTNLWANTWGIGEIAPTNGMAVDSVGNVVVTTGNYTAKVANNGSFLWGTPGISGEQYLSMAGDAAGNTAVVGTIDTVHIDAGTSLLVRRILPNGVISWTARYSGPGVMNNQLVGMKVTPSGNVWVVIYSADALMYSPDGDLVSSNAVPKLVVPGFAVDSADNFILAFVDTNGTTVCKYGPDGNLQWRKFSTQVHSYLVGVDSHDNIYLASDGWSISKLSPLGNVLWTKSNLGGLNNPQDMCVDYMGNVCLVGAIVTDTTFADYLTMKVRTDGTVAWTRALPLKGIQEAGRVCVDGFGNVYVTGNTSASGDTFNLLSVKYDSSGTLEWEVYEPNFGWADAAVDRTGNFYIAGSPPDESFRVLKYNPFGVREWMYATSEAGSAQSITLDPCGNAFVTGCESVLGLDKTRVDLLTMKLSPSGELLWQSRNRGFENENSNQYLGLDRTGNIYVSGRIEYGGLGQLNEATTTLKYQPVLHLSAQSYTFNFHDAPLGCTAAETLAVYSNVCTLSGLSVTTSDPEFTVVPLNSTGAQTSTRSFLLTFTPLSGGPKSAHLTLSNSTAHASLEITATGVGIGRPRYSAESIEFDTVSVGCTRSAELRIISTDCLGLSFRSFDIDDSDFTIITSPSTLAVHGKDSMSVTLVFSPLAIGPHRGRLVVSMSDPGIPPDTILLSGTGTGDGTEAQATQNLGKGWQLFSLPFHTLCPRIVPLSFAYAGQYTRSDTLVPGRGYWHNSAVRSISFAGKPIVSETIHVDAQWNMIGSVSIPISVSWVKSDPSGIVSSSFFGYGSNGYAIADTLRPCCGYWVKVSQAGTLILSAASPVVEPETAQSLPRPDSAEGANLVLISADGQQRELYYSGCPSNQTKEKDAELPPIPPGEEVLDVRYDNGTMFSFFPPGYSSPRTIRIHSARFPMTIRWFVPPTEPTALLVTLDSAIYLRGSGETRIDRPLEDLELRISSGPSGAAPSFKLLSNYPNPFNGSTTIRYELPAESIVRASVFNVIGEKVRALVTDANEGAGGHAILWNALDDNGRQVSSGVYFMRLTAMNKTAPGTTFNSAQKLLLIR